MPTDLIAKALEFTQAVQEGRSLSELKELLDPEIVQIEYPNALAATIVRRSLQEMEQANERGKKIISSQTYEINKVHLAGDTVILETTWKGKLAVAIGKLAAGDEMVAYFSQFYQFKDGKIAEIRNYDCFLPFA